MAKSQLVRNWHKDSTTWKKNQTAQAEGREFPG